MPSRGHYYQAPDHQSEYPPPTRRYQPPPTSYGQSEPSRSQFLTAARRSNTPRCGCGTTLLGREQLRSGRCDRCDYLPSPSLSSHSNGGSNYSTGAERAPTTRQAQSVRTSAPHHNNYPHPPSSSLHPPMLGRGYHQTLSLPISRGRAHTSNGRLSPSPEPYVEQLHRRGDYLLVGAGDEFGSDPPAIRRDDFSGFDELEGYPGSSGSGAYGGHSRGGYHGGFHYS
ncbi:hypothetical protein BJ508DRAFT_379898 [Ascobolus immersus RN42]|uniref:Uncharacterized protein n=1 Tax=Ascobolus immersus RN42 TaxID=1160509 RepID=A0A3N4HUT2_ASCIM|nr:hypothetical protein BJ508DRAFT_379898 [Ascobolus immersus RN42]